MEQIFPWVSLGLPITRLGARLSELMHWQQDGADPYCPCRNIHRSR
jgi:hypothetical protein